MPVEIGAPAPITNHVFGDIDAVRNAGRQLSLAGDHLDQFQQGLDGAGSGVRGQWTGDAARAFSDSTRLAVDDLRTISLACREASDILFTLANELTNALGTAEHMRRVAEADNLIVSPDFTVAGELMTTEKCFNQRTAILAEATFEQARQHARDAHKAAASALADVLPDWWAPISAVAGPTDRLWSLVGAPVAVADARRQSAIAAGEKAAEARKAWEAGRGKPGSGARETQWNLWRNKAAALNKSATSAERVAGGAAGRITGKFLGTSPADIPAVSRLGRAGRWAKSVPLLTAFTTWVGYRSDTRAGVKPGTALAANLGGAAPGVLASAATGVAVTFGAPPLLVAVGVAAVAYGAGSAIHGSIAYGDPSHDFRSDGELAAYTLKVAQETMPK